MRHSKLPGDTPDSAGTALRLDSPPSPRDCSVGTAAEVASTPLYDDIPSANVILPYYDNSRRYLLGPAEMDGRAVVVATVVTAGTAGYGVQLTFTHAGSVELNHIASERYPFYKSDPSNPPYQSMEAVELNGTVVSARAIETASLDRKFVIVGSTAAPLTNSEAHGLALHIDLARDQARLSTATPSTHT